VVWIQTEATAAALSEWSVFYDMSTPDMKAKRIGAMTKDSIGHALWSELDVQPQDLLVTKQRFSAFIQGSSPIVGELRARGIDTVLVTGTVTNVCCESTARDAMMLNFKTVMISDGNAAVTDEEHAASLIAFYLNFGDVLTTDEAIQALANPAQARAVA
jgi:ureidoacrylate peracid hydrolase